MNVNTIRRAVRSGAKTAPVERVRRAKKIGGNPRLTPAELTIALQIAQADRIERDIDAYAIRKRMAVECA